MLLPALLGFSYLKNTQSERIDVVRKAQVTPVNYACDQFQSVAKDTNVTSLKSS